MIHRSTYDWSFLYDFVRVISLFIHQLLSDGVSRYTRRCSSYFYSLSLFATDAVDMNGLNRENLRRSYHLVQHEALLHADHIEAFTNTFPHIRGGGIAS